MALHLGPRPEAEIHLPVVTPSEQLSSQKICFSSYLERISSQRRDKNGSSTKIRTPKRQRKDSSTDKDGDQKKFKLDESEPRNLISIEESAIDGIELMANYKIHQEDEEKPSTEDEKEQKSEETAEEEADRDILERDKDMSEREKDSFSEMEDDDKYNKSDSDNESDSGKIGKERKFKNLKVKFRIRPKKRGGSIYTLVMDNPEDPKSEEPAKEEDPKPDIDVETALKQIRKGWSMHDAGDLTIGDLYLMFGSRSKLELDYWWAEPTAPLPQKSKPETTDKREKSDKGADSSVEDEKERARESDNDIFSPKNTFSQDSNDGMSGDERKCEHLASPDHKSSSGDTTLKLVNKLINRPTTQQPDQNGFSMLSDRLKRLLALVGNTHVSPGAAAPIARCNCGHVCPQQRKQKHQVCTQHPIPTVPRIDEINSSVFRHPTPVASRPENETTQASLKAEETSSVFRHPTPIAPRPDSEAARPMDLAMVPRWRRGRPRLADRRVVVQRLLPLLPKLPPPSNLIPVKILPNTTPAPPRILPKPPPTNTSDLPFFYVLSESNGQFFFHDGDRRIPITAPSQNGTEHDEHDTQDTVDVKDEVKIEATSNSSENSKESYKAPEQSIKPDTEEHRGNNPDIGTEFLPSESLSLSPSRLLRDAEGWLEGSVQDFSLSSFLGHLEGRPHPDLAVDSHLHSLLAESSVDYVAKFADLAAEVTDEVNLASEDLT